MTNTDELRPPSDVFRRQSYATFVREYRKDGYSEYLRGWFDGMTYGDYMALKISDATFKQQRRISSHLYQRRIREGEQSSD